MKKYLTIAAVMLFACTLHAEAALNNDLSIGKSGPDVTELQNLLIKLGFNIEAISSGRVLPGYFGLQTKLAVIAYQKSLGLPQTGYVGPLTRTRLNSTINNEKYVSVITPNGGENWQIGSNQTIRWKKSASTSARYIDIKIQHYYPPCTGQICPMTPASFPYIVPQTIAEAISIDNLEFSWKVGEVLEAIPYPNASGNFPKPAKTILSAGNYSISICESGTSNCDGSDNYFSLFEKPTTPITVLTPNGGENWPAKSVRNISWENTDKSRNRKVDIYLSSDVCRLTGSAACPPAYYVLDKNINSNQSYNWIVATDINDLSIPYGKYKILVCKAETVLNVDYQRPEPNTADCDSSDNLFTISIPGV